MSIRAKLAAAIAVSVAAVALASAALVRSAGEQGVRLAAEQAIAGAAEDFASLERADVEKLDATLRALSGQDALVDAFAARDRRRLLAAAAPVFDALRQNHDITHMSFIEPEPSRRVLLRVHRPEQWGDVVHRATLRRAEDTLSLGAGKELGQSSFALRVVRPWYARDGSLVGYAELAEEIDHFVARLKQETGDDYGLLVEKVFLDRQAWARSRQGKRDGWDDRPRTVLVNATSPDGALVGFDGDMSAVPDVGLVLDEREQDGRVKVRGIVPVKDAAGRRVGGLFVLHDLTALRASAAEARRRIFAVLAGLAAALVMALVAFVDGLVFRRLGRMTHDVEVLTGRLAVGDLDVRVPKATTADEVGRFEGSLGEFVQRVVGLLRDAARRRPPG
jgi:HAMP domain-containing protein